MQGKNILDELKPFSI